MFFITNKPRYDFDSGLVVVGGVFSTEEKAEKFCR